MGRARESIVRSCSVGASEKIVVTMVKLNSAKPLE